MRLRLTGLPLGHSRIMKGVVICVAGFYIQRSCAAFCFGPEVQSIGLRQSHSAVAELHLWPVYDVACKYDTDILCIL